MRKVENSDVEQCHRLVAEYGESRAVHTLDTLEGRSGWGEVVLAEYKRRLREIFEQDGVLTGDPDTVTGLLPGFERLYWPTLETFLREEKQWPSHVVDSIAKTSATVMSHLGNPGEPCFDCRGLVLGYVQSGKTAGYMAALARAADAGYRLFIVLTGMLDTLRNQTQGRLDAELFSRTPHWYQMTGAETDFSRGAHNNLATLILDNKDSRVICVVKKNTHVLAELCEWLREAGALTLEACPTLVIDDEADQASLNTSGQDRSAINKHITDLLEMLPRSTYVAYTATPFANVLVDPSDEKDLYPRDFIMSMPEPSDYFGASMLFGRQPLTEEERDEELGGVDMVREIPEDDILALCAPSRDERDSFQPIMTDTLEEALIYFLLTCAARRARGHKDQHMSMLVHTSVYTVMHEKLAHLILEWFRSFKATWNKNRSRLEELWELESARVSAEDMHERPTSFSKLSTHLKDVFDHTFIVEENGTSDRRLEFNKGPRIQIAVGGNSLSRGLTIEGLCVSYFLRRSMQYDTLLQMGRWFGYRHGYSDLPRIYTTAELADAFEHLATVEEEIRRDITIYDRDGLTPMDFGVRVRTHPEMAITSPNKMSSTDVCNISFSGRTVQTTCFSHKDATWLAQNMSAARELVTKIEQTTSAELVWGERHVLYRDVNVDLVLDFLSSYAIHKKQGHMSNSLLTSYINTQRANKALENWNVAIIGRTKHVAGSLDDLVPGLKVGLLNRSRLSKSSDAACANLGVITSPLDMAVDLVDSASEFNTLDATQRANRLRELRNPKPGTRSGLLLIYPINKDSPGKSKNREDLSASEHVIGMAMVFPEATTHTTVSYVCASFNFGGVQ